RPFWIASATRRAAKSFCCAASCLVVAGRQSPPKRRVKFLSRIALALAALGVLVAIVRTCLRPAAHPDPQRRQAICDPALSPRVALVVVDALRADTFFGDAFADFRAAPPVAA